MNAMDRRDRETEELLLLATSSAEARAKKTARSLDAAIYETKDAMKELESMMHKVLKERELVMAEVDHTHETQQKHNAQLSDTIDIIAHWSTRPGRYLEADDVIQAIETQSKGLEDALAEIEEYSESLAATASELHALESSLDTAFQNKNHALFWDDTAREMTRGSAKDINPRSPLSEKSWVQSTVLQLNTGSGLIAHSAQLRLSGSAMWARCTKSIARWSGMVLETLDAKREEWILVLQGLDRSIQGVNSEIAQVQKLSQRVMKKKVQLNAQLHLAESRISTRNGRPVDESKRDRAHEALVAEVAELKSVLEQLQRHLDNYAGEQEELLVRLNSLEETLRDASTAFGIDITDSKSCLQCEMAAFGKSAWCYELGYQQTNAPLAINEHSRAVKFGRDVM